MCAGSNHEILAKFFGLRTVAAAGEAGTVHDRKFEGKFVKALKILTVL